MPASIVLRVDPTSLRVRTGTGGMQALCDDDKASIQTTIDDDVLKRQEIAFHSTLVRVRHDGSIGVEGELTLVGNARPVAFDLTVGADDRLSGTAVVKQTDHGISPYSTLFGALKVADVVEVDFDLGLPSG